MPSCSQNMYGDASDATLTKGAFFHPMRTAGWRKLQPSLPGLTVVGAEDMDAVETEEGAESADGDDSQRRQRVATIVKTLKNKQLC